MGTVDQAGALAAQRAVDAAMAEVGDRPNTLQRLALVHLALTAYEGARASQVVAEPIYQVKAGQDWWHDTDKGHWDNYVPESRRIVYAAPVAQQSEAGVSSFELGGTAFAIYPEGPPMKAEDAAAYGKKLEVLHAKLEAGAPTAAAELPNPADLRSAARMVRERLKATPATASWSGCMQSVACDDAADYFERLQAGRESAAPEARQP